MVEHTILIIEDDQKIARFLELELTHEGYRVLVVQDGRIGLDLALQGECDLIVLDVMLPSLSGMEVLRRFRASANTPVIMLTAKDGVTDKVMGLDIGADDYITKPFAIEELLARIRSALRRNKSAEKANEVIELDDVVIDTEKHEVKVRGEVVELTKKEYDLLLFLARNKNVVLSRNKILETIWGYEYAGDTNVVDVYISYLRSKLDLRYGSQLIQTVRGVGYVIKHA